MRFCLAVGLAILAGLGATSAARAGDDDPKGLAFFEKSVRPLLVKHCYECHAADSKKIRGGLLVDSRDGLSTGGDSGAALVPGAPERSLLVKAIRHADPDLQMPPKYKLTEGEVDVLVRWIEMGAPDPRRGDARAAARPAIDLEKGRAFWAFRAVAAPAPPALKDAAWPRSEIDRHVLARLEREGLRPVPDADRATLLRRVTFDLTGLPPEPADVAAFLDDASPDAFARAVDRLLASPRYGERWGRHWLDVARYGESMGRTRNYAFPHAWRYRDYVIAAFNADTPYDRFIVEQLAGDLLPDATPESRIATGFLALGSQDLNEQDARQYQMDLVDEQLDVTTRAILGLTVSCARCHDHKFDPVPTEDYYALAGIFTSTDTLNGYKARGGGNKNYEQPDRLLSVGPRKAAAPSDARTREAADLERRLKELEAAQKPKAKGAAAKAAKQEIKDLEERIARLRSATPAPSEGGDRAMGARDLSKPADCRVHLKGEVDQLGSSVPRGFLRVIGGGEAIPAGASGRLELARWMTSASHPLTARVLVNRVWQHLLGRGLVATVDNFGASGETPSHPELLDHLAATFTADGRSVKRLIRRIVLSRTYGLSAAHDAAADAKDPDNVLLWRASPRRLEAEAIRDAMLAVSGTLDLGDPGPSAVSRLGAKQVSGNKGAPGQVSASPHRSVFQPILRGTPPGMLEAFDFPEPSQVAGRRDTTTVPPQALFMMNNAFVAEQARKAAERLLADGDADPVRRIAEAWRRALGRTPTEAETSRVRNYLAAGSGKPLDAWSGVFHALFAGAEFRYVN